MIMMIIMITIIDYSYTTMTIMIKGGWDMIMLGRHVGMDLLVTIIITVIVLVIHDDSSNSSNSSNSRNSSNSSNSNRTRDCPCGRRRARAGRTGLDYTRLYYITVYYGIVSYSIVLYRPLRNATVFCA